ncbi:HTH-type transcriptional regulator RutR [Pseudomonas sp. THAF187a]|nr:HTH-type transcriptional regulator RutR [Pseudomonas sp. THAF187a]QFT43063.1 HTH-type transcriptional regulator RutR [Pseudomonas sp. THAF42]|tara:strand:- start:280 stop:966 length:687 start_codon:yes stop_codon:yes gene_type:complete
MPDRRPAEKENTGPMTSIRERNKELILRAASEEFADKGFAATKTSDIAAKAGLPKPNVYYYFKSKENLYREVLESIVDPLLAASAPFNQPGHPSEVLTAYIRSKIRISRELPHASKVFASEIMHGAPHLSPEQTEQLNAQAKHNIACIQRWVDQGLMAPVDPHHLLFSIWAATQTYADFDWQISIVTGKASLDDADYEAAAQTIIRLVLKGCDVDPLPSSASELVTSA